MKILRHIIILSALIATGCTDDIDVTAGYDYDTVDGEYFIISAATEPQSRVTYEDNTTKFEDGDRVGMFALNADNSLMAGTVENACYYVSSIANVDPEKPSRQVLKPVIETEAVPKGAARYMVYYPYRENITLEQAKQLNHSVRHNQSDIADYEASDLIWDIAIPDAAKNCVNIAFDHAMANFIVKIERELLDSDKGIYLLGSALTAKGINLTAGSLDEMLYTTDDDDAAATGIAMCPFGYANNGELLFRVAIPAHQSVFTKDSDILRIYRPDGSEKIYRLATDIDLRPGFNYTLTIRKGSNIQIVPEAGDDDSWVLEVIDPTDGELVGYLCREYIYWAPAEHATNYRSAPINDGDYMFTMGEGNLGDTGHSSYMISTNPASDDLLEQLNVDGHSVTKDGMFPAINSQAWVFYNLKPGTKIPDLTKGDILRFVYDIKGGGGHPGYTPFIHPKYAYLPEKKDIVMAIWPKPHVSSISSANFQGIFKAKHGHEKVNTIALQGGSTGYSYDSEEHLEFYMHGGTITWDPTNNIVDRFFMPDFKITNQVAIDNGHIAISIENGVKHATISYTPMTSDTEDDDGNSVGQLIIKNLYVNGVAYPLRKVGFNQFWSAKSLHNLTDNEGHKLECFNTEGDVGEVNYDPWSGENKPASNDRIKFRANQKLPAGYIYPCAKGGDTSESYTYDEDFDPYANPEYRPELALLYNVTAFTEGKLKPKNTLEESFRHPTWTDIISLRRYGGVLFAAKWITDDMRTKKADETYVESTTEALRQGMLLGNSAFCANISGLDFRAFGMKWPEYNNNGKVTDFGVRNYFFIDATKENPFYLSNDEWDLNADIMNWVEIFRFSPWDCWGSNPISNYRHSFYRINEAKQYRPIAHSRIFAPVRVIMSFNNPIGNGAQEAEAARSRASIMIQQPAPRESRNIFVPLSD